MGPIWGLKARAIVTNHDGPRPRVKSGRHGVSRRPSSAPLARRCPGQKLDALSLEWGARQVSSRPVLTGAPPATPAPGAALRLSGRGRIGGLLALSDTRLLGTATTFFEDQAAGIPFAIPACCYRSQSLAVLVSLSASPSPFSGLASSQVVLSSHRPECLALGMFPWKMMAFCLDCPSAPSAHSLRRLQSKRTPFQS